MADRWLTTGQLAKETGLSHSTLTAYAASGALVPAWRTPGGHLRWDLEDAKHQLQELARKNREDRP